MPGMESAKICFLSLVMSMARLGAVFYVVPFMGQQVMPGMIRNCIAVCFSLVVYPLAASGIRPETPMVYLSFIAVKEVFIGTLIGFLASVIFWTAEGIGFFIDNQRGATIASTIDPMSGSQTSPLGSLVFQMVTAFFFVSGGFALLLSVIYESYRIWPVFSFFPGIDTDFALVFLETADRLMRMVVILASPVIISVFISELGLGLISRFAQQLNVFFLAMPVKSAVACWILILYLSFLIEFFRAGFFRIDLIPATLGSVLK